MTVNHPDVLEDLVQDRTHLVKAAVSDGAVAWEARILGVLGPEGAALMELAADFPMWNELAYRTTGPLPDGEYRASALAWLQELGLDPDATDVVLMLPDCVERLRPDAA